MSSVMRRSVSLMDRRLCAVVAVGHEPGQAARVTVLAHQVLGPPRVGRGAGSSHRTAWSDADHPEARRRSPGHGVRHRSA